MVYKGDLEDRESFRLENRSVGREVEALGKSHVLTSRMSSREE